MDIKDNVTHDRTVWAIFDEVDIRAILSKYLAEKIDFKIDGRKTLIDVRFEKRDEDTLGHKNYIKVTMTNDLNEDKNGYK